MKPSRRATARTVLLLLVSSVMATTGAGLVFGDDLGTDHSSKIETIIEKAEASYTQGHEAFARGDVAAARRARVHTIVLPQQNRRDMEEVPKELQKEISFVFAESVRQALKVAFAPNEEK